MSNEQKDAQMVADMRAIAPKRSSYGVEKNTHPRRQVSFDQWIDEQPWGSEE